ncbi:GNAT family N-acetyltransferase [Ancylobacter sp. A5.8]|uniref:GNAT family N-acetyltransferase n=1 Tax=Ancylobacter gelatini TaxID=2919920 RepID=UPI001F4E90AA|nr:GNAT family N-acetyltransferase [Ancylobacter gelatini]MCJ8145072.1 GNAT family N-acetyltransferase [Ancylobacter gelatini]
MGHFEISSLDSEAAARAVPALADVLMDCVAGGASVGFMAPLGRDNAEGFWHRVAAGVAAGERVLLVAREGGEIVGTVQLVFAPENQPHRGDVAKMLVARRARRQGLGEALMRAVEQVAREAGLTLLMLDTTTGLAADRLYRRLGWTVFGEVPGHALMPDGAMSDTSFFYKTI